MSTARKLMTADEFLVWCLDQEDTFELVDGVPVLKNDNGPEMMAGATRNHDQIVVNLIALLRAKLRGGPCGPSTADQASRMLRGNIRRPDVTIDCGPRDPTALESVRPAVFFEVLSRTTRRSDWLIKPDEYRRVPTLQHFVVLDSGVPLARLWTRNADGSWTDEAVAGLDAELDLSGVGVRLRLADVYEDVVLDELPRAGWQQN